MSAAKEQLAVVDASSARNAAIDLPRTERLVALLSDVSIPLIHFGSAAALGDCGPDAVDESAQCKPLSEYGRIKFSQEVSVLEASAGGAQNVVLRIFNVIGGVPSREIQPFDTFARRVVAHAASRSSAEKLLIEIQDPNIVRDLVTAPSVGRLTALLVRRLLGSDDYFPPLVNICTGKGWGLGDFLCQLGEVLGVHLQIVGTGPASPVRCVVGKTDLLHNLTGLTPSFQMIEEARSLWQMN